MAIPEVRAARQQGLDIHIHCDCHARAPPATPMPRCYAEVLAEHINTTIAPQAQASPGAAATSSPSARPERRAISPVPTSRLDELRDPSNR